MDARRRGEIAWILLKRQCEKNGIQQGNNLKRAAGHLSKLSGSVDEAKIAFVYMAIFEQIFKETFSSILVIPPEKRKEYKIDSQTIPRVTLDEINRIAYEILKAEIKSEPLTLSKERFLKGIQNMADDTQIPKEELMEFWAEIYRNCF